MNRWRAVLDDQTCEACLAHHGKTQYRSPICTNPNGCRCVMESQANKAQDNESDEI